MKRALTQISMRHLLAALAVLGLLGATACKTTTTRQLQEIKPHANKDVAIMETYDNYVQTRFYNCKLDGSQLVCSQACGAKFKCPEWIRSLNASVSPEARTGGQTATAGSSGSMGTSGTTPSSDKGAMEDASDKMGSSTDGEGSGMNNGDAADEGSDMEEGGK